MPRGKAPSLSRTAMPPLPSSMKPPPSVKAWSVMVTPSTVTVEPSGIARALAIEIGEGVGAGVGVGIGVGEGVGVGEGDALALGVGVGVALADGVGVWLGEALALGLPLALGLGVALGTGGDVLFCGSGIDRIAKSLAFRSVSWPDPALPPGR